MRRASTSPTCRAAATDSGSTSGTSSSERFEQTIDLGEKGLVPLEVRWLHDPDAEQGFVGAALSSVMFNFHRSNGSWAADPVIEVDSVPLEGWPFPVPGLITDLVLSMDDRFLYFANWLHGDVRQYDVSDPANPRLTGRLWLGGVLGKPSASGSALSGGPNMLQLSYDGRRLYVTNSLYSTWDNQFYPDMHSWLLRIDCDPDGGMEVDHDFFVDFHDRPEDRPARTRCAFRTGTARRRSSSDQRPHHGNSRRGERAGARTGRRSDPDRRGDRRSSELRPVPTPATGPRHEP